MVTIAWNAVTPHKSLKCLCMFAIHSLVDVRRSADLWRRAGAWLLAICCCKLHMGFVGLALHCLHMIRLTQAAAYLNKKQRGHRVRQLAACQEQ